MPREIKQTIQEAANNSFSTRATGIQPPTFKTGLFEDTSAEYSSARRIEFCGGTRRGTNDFVLVQRRDEATNRLGGPTNTELVAWSTTGVLAGRLTKQLSAKRTIR
jgi:hypothetical protein